MANVSEHEGMMNGAQGRNRTTDTAIFSRMLYQLSYLGVLRRVNGRKVRPYRKRLAACKVRNGLNSGFDCSHEKNL